MLFYIIEKVIKLVWLFNQFQFTQIIKNLMHFQINRMNHLLIIGINNYPKFEHPKNILPSCVKDVIDFKFVLMEKYFFEKENIDELIDDKATNLKYKKHLKNMLEY